MAGGDFTAVRAQGLTLAYDGVRLDAYRDAPIDEAFLDALDVGFADARAAGLKVIVRFVYNDGYEPDAPLDRVLEHVSQLAPVLRANADVIAVVQAGFIGAWGEWHSSTNGLDDDPTARATVLAFLLDALPDERMTQLRTPMFKAAAYGGPLVDEQAFSGIDAARVGHHNDCFLASDSDLGTYDAPIDAWKAFVAQEGRFTAVGGETCAVNPPRSDCTTALAELALLHWSFLNVAYHPDVLGGWAAQGCLPEIRRRLGYRLVLRRVRRGAAAVPGGTLPVEVTLENVGFAAPFNPRPVVLVLDRGAQREELTLPDVDPRRWEPGAPVVFEAEIPIPTDATPGMWRLSLWLPDAAEALRSRPEYAVRLASDGVWDDETGLNVLAEVPVSP